MSPGHRAFRGKIATLGFDLAAAAASMAIATGLGFALEGLEASFGQMAFSGLVMAMGFVVTALIAFLFLSIHHQVWRHMGASDAWRVGQAALLAVLLFVPLLMLIGTALAVPRTAILIVIPIWLAALFAGRMIALSRSTERPLRLFRQIDEDAPRVLLVGYSNDVAAALRNDETASSIQALGILTLDAPEKGRAIQGVTLIGGTEALGDAIDLMQARYGDAPWIAIVGDPRAPEELSHVLSTAAERGSKLMALSTGRPDAPLRTLKPSDLLGRPEHCLDTSHLDRLIRGKRILVTGAGGSIGSALVRACLPFEPASLTLFEQSEFNLYTLLTDLADTAPDLPVTGRIGDVRDMYRLAQVFSEAKPEIVLHSAALKHVPLVEENPCEAVLTNVLGARDVANAAVAAGAERFVFISSDKAARPSSAMGATKRLAEITLTDFATRHPQMAVAMVRFGNVLGSSGSVVPRFEAQIRAGGPVTVSHPDMTRYFMTIEEAAQLVLAAGSLAKPGGNASLFMLDMGEPVRILELAETMIRLSGKVPHRDIAVVFTGSRDGDRMHEALTDTNEAPCPTAIDGIFAVQRADATAVSDSLAFRRLVEAATARDNLAACEALSRLVPGYSAGGQSAA
jgi:FlaA1/EpsC-like NDP-sugar epimerase